MLVVGAAAVALALLVTLTQEPAYRSNFSLLVIEQQEQLDGYAAAKSAERISVSLGQLLYTDSFAQKVYDRVKDTGLVDDTVFFAADAQARRAGWKHNVETRVLPDVGMLKISVYHPDQETAETIAQSIATVLVEQGTEYLGGGTNVVLKTVDFPLTSKAPVRPNILLNMIAGFVLGLGGAFAFFALTTRRAATFAVPTYQDEAALPQRHQRDYSEEQLLPRRSPASSFALHDETMQPPQNVVTANAAADDQRRALDEPMVARTTEPPENLPYGAADDAWDVADESNEDVRGRAGFRTEQLVWRMP